MRAPFRVALFGLGNVGGALARRLVEDADRITMAAGRPIAIEGIAVAHPEGRRAPAPILPAAQLLARPRLDAIVEVMGGLEPASTYIRSALQAGRQVITANKQLVAAQGPRLACLGPLRFEASVASAIPTPERTSTPTIRPPSSQFSRCWPSGGASTRPRSSAWEFGMWDPSKSRMVD